MALDQGLFDQRQDALSYYTGVQAELADSTLAHMLAVQLLDRSMEVGEEFEFDEAGLRGAQDALLALMQGRVSIEVIDERDINYASLREATVAEFLRRTHIATAEVVGVMIPGTAIEIQHG